jgi:hypothetical protein
VTADPIDRKYRMSTWGRTTYGFPHNDGKRMVFVDQFPAGWRYGLVSIEEVRVARERLGDDRGEALRAFNAWVSDIASSSHPYRTRKAAIEAALREGS